jgi:hypothetical protein
MSPRRIVLIQAAIFLVFSAGLSAQVNLSVDQGRLSTQARESLSAELCFMFESAVEKGELHLVEETFLYEVLRPYEAFGINPDDPRIYANFMDIKTRIDGKIRENPAYNRGNLWKSEIGDLVQTGLMNYAASLIDSESREIMREFSNMASEANKQISDLLKATQEIQNLSPDYSGYEADMVGILKKYGFDSDYFHLINDLDLNIRLMYDQVAGPAQALYSVVSALRSDDPVYKIETLFSLGQEFGAKIPILGVFVRDLFRVGSEMLRAAKGLEGILEKNLNQGCISVDGGTYGIVNDHKRSSFLRMFPHVGYACPISQTVYSPVYNNIYLNMDQADQLFFFINGQWNGGRTGLHHAGKGDITGLIAWGRRNGKAELASDLELVYRCYQREYGFMAAESEILSRLDRIHQHLSDQLSLIHYCDAAAVEYYFMNTMYFIYFTTLVNRGGYDIGWDDLRVSFAQYKQVIRDQLLMQFYYGNGDLELDRLDFVLGKLDAYDLAEVYGVVRHWDGQPVEGAEVKPERWIAEFLGTGCNRIRTGWNGQFSFIAQIPRSQSNDFRVLAFHDDKTFASEMVRPGSPPERHIRLVLTGHPPPDELAQEAGDGGETGDGRDDGTGAAEPSDEGEDTREDTADEGGDTGLPPELAPDMVDCSDPYAYKYLLDDGREFCVCTHYYVWNAAARRCVPDVQAILAASDCSAYANTEVKWDYQREEPYCDCLPGYLWEPDYSGCIETRDMLVSQADCSGYPNSRAVWDDYHQRVACDCLPGFVWDEHYTRCMPESEAGLAGTDCSHLDNTQALWDPVRKESYCDCLPGYQWRDDYSGCERERTSPPIDMDALMTLIELMTGSGPRPNISSPQTGTGSSQPPVVVQSRCNNQQRAGGSRPEVHQIDLGITHGTFRFDYETYTAKDQIVITQGGRVLFDSGCVGERKSVTVQFGGYTSMIEVRVNPDCAGTTNTAWNFTVFCP